MTDILHDSPEASLETHDCPYEGRLEEVAARQTPSFRWSVGRVGRILADIHAEGNCPPTHIDGQPTRAWSDLVRDTKA